MSADVPDVRFGGSIEWLRSAYMPTTRAQCFDPSAGTYQPIGQAPNTGTKVFTPPGKNAEGSGDWVLVLEAP